MKKARTIAAGIAIAAIIFLVVYIIMPLALTFAAGLYIRLTSTVYTEIITVYGDRFTLRKHEWGLPDVNTQFDFIYNEETLFSALISTDFPSYYYDSEIEDTWDEIVNSYSKGQIRIYELGWGIAYTQDGGASFKGVPRDEYTDRYRADEEFIKIYEMLYCEPFYEKRVAEHLDMDKPELPDSQMTDKMDVHIHINSVEELLGKAQMAANLETDKTTGRITYFTLEYELADGQILVVEYRNEDWEEPPGFYVSSFSVRSPYYLNKE